MAKGRGGGLVSRMEMTFMMGGPGGFLSARRPAPSFSTVLLAVHCAEPQLARLC